MSTPPPAVPRPAVVLGIDPGTRVVGYGAVTGGVRGPRLFAAGVLRAPARASVPARLATLRAQLDELLSRLRPAVVVVERAFAGTNVQSALRMGEGRGVVLACASACGAQVVEMPPAVAKKALVGHGGADKTQVARMVAQALGIEPLALPLDASDALSLALAHLQRSRLESLTGRAAAPRSRAPAATLRRMRRA